MRGRGGKKEKPLGLDEIDSLFANKKEHAKLTQERMRVEVEEIRLERKRRKRARAEEEAEEFALRGVAGGGTSSSSSSAAAAGGGGKGGKGDAVAPAHLHERATKMRSLTYTREDVERLNGKRTDDGDENDNYRTQGGGDNGNRWAYDGLGGVFNGEGYTGRRDGGGHRVFKAHLMNRKGFGNSPDCPFDCDCCFI